jgi:hypothetical protein
MEKREKETVLLKALKLQITDLEELLKRAESHWQEEDCFYRFYHQSFKVYGLQKMTEEIVGVLTKLLPETPLNADFSRIIQEGTGKKFDISHNQRWHEETRPILEAYFHAKTMLKLAIKYAKELETPPDILPSGWGTILYLYNLR